MAPDKKIPSRSVTGGALFTTVCWILITYAYSYYIEKYANYSIFYGGLANIVIIMLWVYLLSYILVIGMAMNFHEEMEKTGIIEVKKAIEESANIEAVFPNPKDEKKEELIKEEPTEPVAEEPKKNTKKENKKNKEATKK